MRFNIDYKYDKSYKHLSCCWIELNNDVLLKKNAILVGYNELFFFLILIFIDFFFQIIFFLFLTLIPFKKISFYLIFCFLIVLKIIAKHIMNEYLICLFI